MFYILFLAVWVNSCHIYKPYDRPEVNISGLYRDPFSPVDTLGTDTANLGFVAWRTIFQDDTLQYLIEKGLANNIDLQIARLRIDEAKALLLAARLAYLPSFGLSPEGTVSWRNHTKASQTYQLPLVTSWEIDLFGNLLNASRGEHASLLASEAYRQSVRSELITNIANSYYTLLMLDQQLSISEKTAAVWLDNIRVMVALKEIGTTNEAAIVQSRANYYEVEASLYDLKMQIRETENALSILLGEAPQEIPRSNLYSQKLPDYLPPGIPAQLLANRPDVRYAEMQLAIAYYATNQARAAFYPQISITGSAGWTNDLGSAIANSGKFILSAVGSLTQPLFNRGSNIAQLRVSKAQQEEALLSFQESLLTAGQEVSDALYQYEASIEKRVERRSQIEELEKAVTYTQALFRSGESTYLKILTAQQSLLSAQLNEVSDLFENMQAVVNLYKALGGGREE
ncbi:MAG: TolC family protein [Tannerellaceae bacterium]|nr:TolC family protein [Tannerellaceae bacterium]